MMTMPLSKLFANASRDPLIRELTLDSRAVRPGDLFLAVPGAKVDGRDHIADALARAPPRWPTKSKVPAYCRSPTRR